MGCVGNAKKYCAILFNIAQLKMVTLRCHCAKYCSATLRNVALLDHTASISHIRLLANAEHRVSKHDVVKHNIPKIVTDILNEERIAPKFSGQLLLGTVKLYKRKMDDLLRDCSEVISKIQLVSFWTLVPGSRSL